MKTGFIGAGKVGFTLGRYFVDNGAQVTGYYSRSAESAEEAAAFTGTRSFESIEELALESGVLLLTVPDSAIKQVWNVIKNMPISGKIICHCSGAMTSEVFDGINSKGAYGYSVHPFYSINSRLTSYKEFSRAFFTLEGKGERLEKLKRFIEEMGNPVYIVAGERKVKYHAAAVFLSNLVTALAHTGCELLMECGFDKEFTDFALKTLFLNNSCAIAENGTVKPLTGPVERNDLQTVKKHLECLDGNERRLYELLSMQLVKIAKEKHAGNDYSALKRLIETETEEKN